MSDAISILDAQSPGHRLSASRRESIGQYADRMRRLRLRRNDWLGADVTRDPAWDILLGLVAAKGEGRDACVKTLSFGTGVPQTTALRHIERLEHIGLIRREPHGSDQRRTTVVIAPDRIAAIEDLIDKFREKY